MIDVKADSVGLSWSAPRNDGGKQITGYKMEKREVGTDEWVMATPGAVNGTQATVRGLQTGTEYEFRVAAVNEVGVGEMSEPTEPVKVAPPPVAHTAGPVSTDEGRLPQTAQYSSQNIPIFININSHSRTTQNTISTILSNIFLNTSQNMSNGGRQVETAQRLHVPNISTITFNIKETEDDMQSTPNSETSSTTTYVSSIPTLETNSETDDGQSTSISTSVTSSTATSHVPSNTAHNESNGVGVEEMDSNHALESRYITNLNNLSTRGTSYSKHYFLYKL